MKRELRRVCRSFEEAKQKQLCYKSNEKLYDVSIYLPSQTTDSVSYMLPNRKVLRLAAKIVQKRTGDLFQKLNIVYLRLESLAKLQYLPLCDGHLDLMILMIDEWSCSLSALSKEFSLCLDLERTTLSLTTRTDGRSVLTTGAVKLYYAICFALCTINARQSCHIVPPTIGTLPTFSLTFLATTARGNQAIMFKLANSSHDYQKGHCVKPPQCVAQKHWAEAISVRLRHTHKRRKK
ncbi:unnamed protein product [Ceratitis capitata]|uniref:(Mediterranean fruit fly) hypothetical protein n=1 Tax=Ceratitis capitata TaxID=7213 RepID=A0A811UM69_CERCA|nr:unnamed protein product [Ceratitis capitata]